MKNRKTVLLSSLAVVFLLLLFTVLAACAPAAPSPGVPTTISPQTPSPTQQAPSRVTPTTKPAPTKPAPAPAAEVYKWKLQSNQPAGSTQVRAYENVASRIKENSQGRLEITVYPMGSLVKTAEILDGLRARTIDAGELYGGYWKGFAPEMGIEVGFPGIYNSAWEIAALMWDRGLMDIMREVYAEHGVRYWNFWCYGGVLIWATQPIRTLDDFHGLKIRAVGEMADALTNMGASSTYIAHEESYMALQLGTIDAYSTGEVAWYDMKHYEIAPYIMDPPVLYGNTAFGISMLAWEELPEDLKGLVEMSGYALSFEITRMSAEGWARVQQEIPSIGGEIVRMDDAVVKRFTEEGMAFLDQYEAKGGRSAQMVRIIREYLRDMGYIE